MNAYNPNKALRHLELLQAAKYAKPAPPAHVQLIISNRCNHRCNFCAYRDPDYTSNQRFVEQDIMPLSKIKQVITDCHKMGVKCIQLTGGGEPSVHPDYEDVLYHLIKTEMPFAVVTNGSDMNRYLQYYKKADWIRVSIDAGYNETYCKTRNLKGEGRLEKVFDGIEILTRARKEHESATKAELASLIWGQKPVIGVGFVVTPHNYREASLCAFLAKKSGADNIRIGCQFSGQGAALFDGIWDAVHASVSTAERHADRKFQVFNRVCEKRQDLISGRPGYSICGYQFFTTYIGADCRVYRCCVTAYNDVGYIGSIKDQSFKDLWISQKRVEEMREFHPMRCERCQFNVQNQLLEFVLDSSRQLHENYV